jgi:membrane associated rhomboid family serine protease
MSAAGTMRDFPATTALTAICLAVFVGMVVSGGSLMEFSPQVLVRWGANFGPLTMSGEYWRLITAGFAHGGLIHIAFNMWCLWSLGQLSERLFGSWITFAIYILTGVAGSMLSIAWNPVRLEIGASGAIFGIAGAILSGIKFGNVAVSSWQKRSIFSSLIFFIGFNLMFGLAPGIDNMCHLGGLVSGLIFGVPLATASASGKKSFEWATIVLAAMVLAGAGQQLVNTRGAQSKKAVAGMALEQRDYPTAIRILEQIAKSEPNDARLQAALGYAYQMNHERDKAIAAYQRALQIDPNMDDVKENLQGLQENQTK